MFLMQVKELAMFEGILVLQRTGLTYSTIRDV